MSDSLIEQLQKSAENAMKSNSFTEGSKHLAKAFSLFSEEAKKIKVEYSLMQKQFEITYEKLNCVSLYLKLLLKNINQAIIFINQNHTITLYNEAAEKLLIKKQKDVLFKPFHAFFKDNCFGFSIQNALKYGLSQNLRYLTMKTVNNQKVEVEVNTNFVYEGPKEHQGIIIIINDITEKNELQLIANRNDRMKEIGEITANVAHEIRNPLGGIRGYATLLFRDLSYDKKLQEMTEHIIEGTKTLERFVTTILQYSKPVQIMTEMEDISIIIKNLKKHIEVDPTCPENIQVALHISNEKLFVPIDKDAIKRAFLNLIVNAYQSMLSGGSLTISLLKRDLSCVICISDTGNGISNENINKIFSPFFTTKSKGNGLGLAETQKIIQAHNGRIDVYSKPNYGTTFTITLPLRR
jgi:PAS domain S-box-containing protein